MFGVSDSAESSRLDGLKVRQASTTKRDPLKALAKKIGLSLGGDGRDFLEPEFDLNVIESAYQTEAYVRQGIDKYIDKMFKAGWNFSGKNPTTVDFIRIRFAYMAEVTQYPTDKMFMEYSEDIVKFSNAILAKARMADQAQLPPSLTIQGYGDNQPVIGYFPLNVATMTIKRDKFGTVKQWQQTVVGQDKPVKFKSQDIIHTYYKRTKGNAFGTPFITPVLDDIRSLRQTEDNVLKMLYRNIHPFYQIKIGSEEFPADDPEIDAAKKEVEGMEVDGGLVTSERWKIDSVAADKVIDAKPFLDYFEQRVFSGLGVPATMFGRGATANKSTSDNMDAEFLDRVKAFQKVIEADVNEFMIKELLLEGGFDSILNPDDMVWFTFNEIDIDNKIKLENQAIYKYEHMAITEDEMRTLLGLDPIVDRSKMFSNLAVFEKAKALADANPKPVAGTTTAPVKKKATTTGTPATNNKVKPTNKKATKNDVETLLLIKQLYTEHLEELREQVADSITDFYDGNRFALSTINTSISLKDEFFKDINIKYLNSDNVNSTNIATERMFVQIREEIASAIISMKSSDSIAKESAIEIVNSVFKVMNHRSTQILDKEV